MITRTYLFFFALLAFFSCKKGFTPGPDPMFEVYLNNEFNELNGRFAVFVSEPDGGKVRAFSWIPGEDTLLLQVPGSTRSDVFDCTVFKVSTIIAPGTGIRDTFLTLTTYAKIAHGERINLRDQVFKQATNLKFSLTGMNSLDSVVVSDAYAIQKPQPSNNYTGEYRCFHTGKCWMRILINGDPFWKFVRFDGVSGPTLEVNTVNTNLFISILAPPIQLNFPFVSEWQYSLDGIVDTSKLEFFPLSQQYLVPGSFVPDIIHAEAFEPVNNDQFDPNRPYDGFRLQTRGPAQDVNGYTYVSDHFYKTIPATLPVPDFDLSPTILADNRLIAVQCSGDFDVLAFSRTREGTLSINWEVLMKPATGIVSYRLPDVPDELGSLYGPLKKYDLGGKVNARAESYESTLSFDQIIRQKMNAADILWQARAGYLAREERY